MSKGSKKPDLPESTLRIMERMVKTPPKPHRESAAATAKRPTAERAVIGYTDEAVEIPGDLQAVMRANSQALAEITS